jgi:hypothetical protein
MFLETTIGNNEFLIPHKQEQEFSKMPAILLWLLGVPIPIIILLLLLWH